MSKQKAKQMQSASFGPFGGMDLRTPHAGIPSAADIVNFRISEDGSLIKREGFGLLTSLEKSIRAVWTGKLFGQKHTLFLCDEQVLSLDLSSGEASLLGTLPEAPEKEAQFFFYRDRLYLLSGSQIYQITEDAITPIHPYIPLVGKNWPTTYIGEPYQPRNLLTRRARIQYTIEENPSAFLRIGHAAKSIDAVYRNQTLLSSDQYQYHPLMKTVAIEGLLQGDQIEIHLTYEGDDQSALPSSCKKVAFFGNTDRDHLLFWDGQKSNVFYPSTYVSPEDLIASQKADPESTPIYLAEHAETVLGDGRHDITGFVRQHDRLLLFTEADAWMTDADDLYALSFSAKPINPIVGCASRGACTMANNHPISLGAHGIYQWTSDTDEYNECNAVCISTPIAELLDPDFFENAKIFYFRAQNEVWFFIPNKKGNIWIYQLDKNAWIRFSDIVATDFFEIDGKLWFYRDKHVFHFNKNFKQDMDETLLWHEIIAKFQSNLLEYGTEQEKHFRSLTLRGDFDGATISVRLLAQGIHTIDCTFFDDGDHATLTRRLCSGRFRYATLQITARGPARQTIHSLISDVR